MRPVIVYAAHAAVPHGVPEEIATHAGVVATIDDLLGRAYKERRWHDARYFDEAWSGLCAWLDETIPQAGFAERFDKNRQPGTAPAFFSALDRLLDAPGFEKFEPQRLRALNVFAHLLELGYHGPYSRAEDAETLALYLRCCREDLALALAEAPAAATAFAESGGTPRSANAAGMLPFWIIPLAVTLAVYTLYNYLLADLYALVMG